MLGQSLQPFAGEQHTSGALSAMKGEAEGLGLNVPPLTVGGGFRNSTQGSFMSESVSSDSPGWKAGVSCIAVSLSKRKAITGSQNALASADVSWVRVLLSADQSEL